MSTCIHAFTAKVPLAGETMNGLRTDGAMEMKHLTPGEQISHHVCMRSPYLSVLKSNLASVLPIFLTSTVFVAAYYKRKKSGSVLQEEKECRVRSSFLQVMQTRQTLTGEGENSILSGKSSIALIPIALMGITNFSLSVVHINSSE